MSTMLNWFWPTKVYKLDPSKIENICFKGGGMKGNAFVGVARAYSELRLWDQTKRFIGTSAGAIFAGAAACRVSHDDLQTEIYHTDFAKFKDANWGILGEGIDIINEFGVYKGDYFYNWYGDFLEKYIGDRKITLQGVYDRFNSELVITTTDITIRKLIFMTKDSHPDLELREAVRRSMSIPVFFIPAKETDQDGLIHYYVDGGCSDNFPIDYFDHLYDSPAEAFNKTIGFNLIEENIDKPGQINNLVDLVTNLTYTVISELDKLRVLPFDKYRTVNINTGDISGTDFDITLEQLKYLDKCGYQATMNFFK